MYRLYSLNILERNIVKNENKPLSLEPILKKFQFCGSEILNYRKKDGSPKIFPKYADISNCIKVGQQV